MCTVVISVDPPAEAPVVLVAVRDEVQGRPWEPPARHWPDHPGVWGGRDVGGGTWLALDPGSLRVSTLLDAEELPARDPRRLSRGKLPLLAVAAGALPDLELDRYQPFRLVLASPEQVRLWHWNGDRLTEDKLGEGTHLIVNTGRENDCDPRITHFHPRFEALARPAGVTDEPPDAYWGPWLDEATGADVPFADPRNIVVWEVGSDGRVWISMSVSLVALSATRLRYDFSADPGNRRSFRRIPV